MPATKCRVQGGQGLNSVNTSFTEVVIASQKIMLWIFCITTQFHVKANIFGQTSLNINL